MGGMYIYKISYNVKNPKSVSKTQRINKLFVSSK